MPSVRLKGAWYRDMNLAGWQMFMYEGLCERMAAKDAQEKQPKYAPEREVRHAVVMYGGVSLAIYMYGVAEELHHLVCSTAADVEDPTRLRAPTSTEAVYRDVAAAMSAGEVKTRFIVDIISGTSAGGINGICLAKALARDAPIRSLKDIWLHEGDISALLNDEESGFARSKTGRGPAIEGAEYERPPRSLLSGGRMQRMLVQALAGITREADDGAPSLLVDELDLWVTSTDLDGLPVTIQLSNATAGERRHANRFHFRYAPTAENRDDFAEDTNAFLAYAARATSAFPFAFEPAVLEKVRRFADRADWAAAKQAWKTFHRPYKTAFPEFAARAFSDGGILDNKPFSYATESLLTRRASVPVERKLLYIEPDPAALAVPAGGEAPDWTALQTARAATLEIPRVETIREDIQAVLARNREIERVRDVLAQVGLSAAERAHIAAVTALRAPDEWAARTLVDDLASGALGPTYGVYYRLKVRGVVDWLGGALLSAAMFDPLSDEALAIHQLVRAWKRRRYHETPSESPDASGHSENAFLVDFDIPYRIRRLDFVAQKFKELTGPDAERAFLSVGAQPPPDDAWTDDTVHRTVRLAIAAARRELVDTNQALITDLADPIRALGLTREHLNDILVARDDDAMLRAAVAIVDARDVAFDAVGATIAARVRTAAESARQRFNDDIRANPVPLCAALCEFYDAFEAYDLALYPLLFGTDLGEANPVEIVRISPLDARGPLEGPREPLKGAGLHHFAAFLDESWRSYDIVWGRLDAAECLIGALLGDGHVERSSLVARAQEQIIVDYAKEHGISESEASAWFKGYRPAAAPDEERTLKALTRAQRVVGRLAVDAMGTSAGTSGAATPLIECVFGDMSRLKAISALARQRSSLLALSALSALFAIGVAVVIGVDGGSWPGGMVMGVAATPLVIGIPGLYFGLGRLRATVEQRMRAAVASVHE